MTAQSIRSGHVETCFCHTQFAGPFSESQKLKENLLAAVFEVDKIEVALDEAPSGESVKYYAGRLFAIDDFNCAMADYIVEKLQKWATRCDTPFPSFSEYVKSDPKCDYAHEKSLAEFAKDREWDEHIQLKSLAPLCEQLSKKISRAFQRAPLLEFQSQLKPPVDIRSQTPERLGLFWGAPMIQEKRLPPLAEVHAIVKENQARRLAEASESTPITSSSQECSSSSSQPSSSSSVSEPQDAPKAVVTARIVVSHEVKPGDSLFIRGTGPGMSWKVGVEMKQEDGKWVFETTEPFDKAFEYKIVRNDKTYAQGANQSIQLGQSKEIAKIRF